MASPPGTTTSGPPGSRERAAATGRQDRFPVRDFSLRWFKNPSLFAVLNTKNRPHGDGLGRGTTPLDGYKSPTSLPDHGRRPALPNTLGASRERLKGDFGSSVRRARTVPDSLLNGRAAYCSPSKPLSTFHNLRSTRSITEPQQHKAWRQFCGRERGLSTRFRHRHLADGARWRIFAHLGLTEGKRAWRWGR